MQAAVGVTREVPIVETERLRLRGHQVEDFAKSFAMWTEPIVVKYTTGKPQTTEEAWARMLRYAGLWSLLGYGYWLVEEKDSGDFVGELGFADFKREITPSLAGMPEIGWVLTPHMHGKGYATEGVRAAIAWGDARFGSQATTCLIHTENTASVRVAEKCGYREWQKTTYKDSEVMLYTRP
jgi:RimJ/RimL family protein N-acetyltransferase